MTWCRHRARVDEDTSTYDSGTSRPRSSSTGRRTCGDPVRRDFVDKTGFEALLSERGISNDNTVLLFGGNNNWFAAYTYGLFRLYGHDKVLLLDGVRRGVGTGLARTEHRRAASARAHQLHRGAGRALRALRDAVIAAIGKRNLVNIRPPTSSPGRLARPGAPAARAGAAGRPHSDRAQRALVQGGQRGRHLPLRRRAHQAVPGRGGSRFRQGHHRLLPDRRAVGTHLVRPARACSTSPTSRTGHARGPNTGRWSACRSSWATADEAPTAAVRPRAASASVRLLAPRP